ncbi:MAG TPA: FtsX-like permease family protein [Verrucomicrobiae bacterium]|nr:FtsX-like permease family protein [Verrucomicrobiae bacterium]
MFGRLLWKMLRSNRGRLAVALVAVASGATVISALLDVQFDVERKLTHEFRALGANIVISAKSDRQVATPGVTVASNSADLLTESVIEQTLDSHRTPDVAASAPFLFSVARVNGTAVVVAGTWLDQLAKLNPTWRIQGNWIASREDVGQCLVGWKAAQQFGVVPGAPIGLDYLGRHAQLRVAGVIDSGGDEDDQIFMNLPAAWELTGEQFYISLWQLSVSGTSAGIESYATQLAGALPGYDVRPVRAITDAEGSLLGRTRLLIASMIALILVLTALCVLATMMALAMERRKDVGLMKALGASISRILAIFLAEVGTLGAVGGAIGSVAGVVLARWVGQRVFGAAIATRWDVFPLTIVLMVCVALAGALPLRLLGRVKPAVILRGE